LRMGRRILCQIGIVQRADEDGKELDEIIFVKYAIQKRDWKEDSQRRNVDGRAVGTKKMTGGKESGNKNNKRNRL